ncbi:hypothetical protein EDB83DRAFT_2682398 [Lactarius deliciosus]|nr:hypothetical protein EDB83DRAFT_2682398 [Lactarius deliciosus]
MHARDIVPENCEILGHSPAGATTDLHMALKFQREGALADALLELTISAHLTSSTGTPRRIPRFSAQVPSGAARKLENHRLDDTLRLATHTHLVADVAQAPKRRSNGADVDVTPSYLHSLYKTIGYIPAAAGLNRLGIWGFLGQYPSPGDLRNPGSRLTMKFRQRRHDGDDSCKDNSSSVVAAAGRQQQRRRSSRTTSTTPTISAPTTTVAARTTAAASSQQQDDIDDADDISTDNDGTRPTTMNGD